MADTSKGLRGFQRVIVPLSGSITTLGLALIIGFAALTYPQLDHVAALALGIAAAVLITVGAATAILLIGYRVPHTARLTTTVALAIVVGEITMFPTQLSAASDGPLASLVTLMLIGAILVLCGIASMCTTVGGPRSGWQESHTATE